MFRAKSFINSMASSMLAAKITPPLDASTVSQKDRRSPGRRLTNSGISSFTLSASDASVVTRNAEESGPCSASMRRSVAAVKASAEASLG